MNSVKAGKGGFTGDRRDRPRGIEVPRLELFHALRSLRTPVNAEGAPESALESVRSTWTLEGKRPAFFSRLCVKYCLRDRRLDKPRGFP